ncbi:hypothetical protein BGZ65_004053 [Modicella reniformis]|uniref:Uncharacterized protein n=1 Tax=Modicella reniformis TaxID=1440133 RepID=A0A9P6MH45_9FUNG|nr:hypothetical protein BGZ65_004053 [Modicella reniformis]
MGMVVEVEMMEVEMEMGVGTATTRDPDRRRAFRKTVSESDASTDEDLTLSEWKKARIGHVQGHLANSAEWLDYRRHQPRNQCTFICYLVWGSSRNHGSQPRACLYSIRFKHHHGLRELPLSPTKRQARGLVQDEDLEMEMELGETTSSASSSRKNAGDEAILRTQSLSSHGDLRVGESVSRPFEIQQLEGH